MRRAVAARLLTAILLTLSNSLPAAAIASPPPDHLLISEVQTGSASNASAEFVELLNPTDAPINLRCTRMQYRSAAGTSWSTKSELSGELPAHQYFLVASAAFSTELPEPTANAVLGSGLAATGGHIRLLMPDVETLDCSAASYSLERVADLLGWGTATAPETAAAAAPAAGQSLKRVFDENGNMKDSNNNAADFVLSDTPLPQNYVPSEPEEPEPEEEPESVVEPAYLPIEVNEVLPDPAAPQTDDADEFVELYNPNDTTVALDGYVLKTGGNLQYQQSLDGLSIEPGNYLTLFSGDFGITLPNSGGKVLIIDPTGAAASELLSYEAAKSGESWGIIDEAWGWSDQLSPSLANLPHTIVLEPEAEDEQQTPVVLKNYPKAEITELLPDPVSPQKDSEDEFVEIFNPSDELLDLTGYVLKSGKDLKTKHVFEDLVVPPRSFIAVFSSTANLSLGNQGGSVQLLDPNGTVISQSGHYDKAAPGSAWAQIDGTWQWTAQPTPASRNVLSAAPAKTSAKKTKKPKTPKKSAPAKKTGGSSAEQVLAAPATISPSPQAGLFIVSGLSLALLYALYEYRHDIRNQIELLKRHRGARRKARGAA